MSSMVSESVTFPSAPGVKVTSSLHFPPGGRIAGHSLATVKLPTSGAPSIITGRPGCFFFPLGFEMVTGFVFDPPILTLPKFNVRGLTFRLTATGVGVAVGVAVVVAVAVAVVVGVAVAAVAVSVGVSDGVGVEVPVAVGVTVAVAAVAV